MRLHPPKMWFIVAAATAIWLLAVYVLWVDHQDCLDALLKIPADQAGASANWQVMCESKAGSVAEVGWTGAIVVAILTGFAVRRRWVR